MRPFLKILVGSQVPREKMVRTCQVDESISGTIQEWIEGKSGVQVGVLVGITGGRDVVLDAFMTPEDESGPPAECKVKEGDKSTKGAKNKSRAGEDEPELVLETDAIVDHAGLVSQMLPGGVWVVGLLLFSPHSGIRPVQQALCGCLKELRKYCKKPEYASDDMLLLHASSVSNKISLKVSPDLQRDPVNLVNSEHSFTTVRNLPYLKCSYEVDIELPFGDSITTRKKMWKEFASIESSKINSALCVTLDELKPLDESKPIRELVDTADPLEVSLVVSLDSNVGGSENGSVHGKGRISGILEARAFCNEKEQLGRCIKTLKADLISSLQSRLRIIEESEISQEEGDSSMPDNRQLDHCFSIPLPRRVWLPWKSGVWMCDYLDRWEDTEVAVQNAAELLSGLKLTAEEIVDEEAQGTADDHVDCPVWDPLPKDTKGGETSPSKPTSSTNPAGQSRSVDSNFPKVLIPGAVAAFAAAVAAAWYASS